LKAGQEFFDGFRPTPLTPEQRLAIVADEDATLVLAVQGPEKQSVICQSRILVRRASANPKKFCFWPSHEMPQQDE
jgi:DNA helicase-4